MISEDKQIQLQLKLNRLTPSQRRIYDIIVFHKIDNDGNSPGREEIMEMAKMKSRSQYDKIIRRLERAGLIGTKPFGKRNILVTGGEWIPPPIR